MGVVWAGYYSNLIVDKNIFSTEEGPMLIPRLLEILRSRRTITGNPLMRRWAPIGPLKTLIVTLAGLLYLRLNSSRDDSNILY